MSKVMKVASSIGLALIIFVVVLLGIEAFYPSPDYDDYGCNTEEPMKIEPCAPDITVAECNELQESQRISQEQISENCYEDYRDADRIYSRNIFFIATTLGVLIFISSWYLLNAINISAGVAFAGILLIFYGFTRGWQGTSAMSRFVASLVIAVIIVIYSAKINKKFR